MASSQAPVLSTQRAISEFLQRAADVSAAIPPTGRLLFALDATASRQPTWDQACQLQSDMFAAAAEVGGLALQLVWYRGYGEFQVEPWLTDAAELQRRMTAVQCRGGLTQMGRVLEHATQETQRRRLNALVLIGDCLEEAVDPLCHRAGQLGLLGVPAFVFQEGCDPNAAQGFREIARLTRGAYCVFDQGSARQLRALLKAVAVYAVGGRQALENFSKRQGGLVRRLTQQL
ncbi:MAG: VWA domain-containing protein [Gammaproteobacteria bacterium]|nr:VWA domain-containing protein [Gammaproteobacteria bacterium]